MVHVLPVYSVNYLLCKSNNISHFCSHTKIAITDICSSSVIYCGQSLIENFTCISWLNKAFQKHFTHWFTIFVDDTWYVEIGKVVVCYMQSSDVPNMSFYTIFGVGLNYTMSSFQLLLPANDDYLVNWGTLEIIDN